MNAQRAHTGKRYFSIAFGLIIIALGAVWFLQSLGIVPAHFSLLGYLCPLCVVIFGLRLMTGNGKEDADVAM